MMFVVSNVHAQMRVGGSTAPNKNAILDLNVNDTINGSKGLLLPRVALISTTNASPLTAHTKGMFVYNTATVNNVSPGIYYNDGTRWVRGESSPEPVEVNVKQLEIIIDEPITTQSMMYYGETVAATNPTMASLQVQNIEPVFSDKIMSKTLFRVISSAKPNEDGTAIKWSVKIANANIDSSKSSNLQKVIITYIYDRELAESNYIESYVFVGQWGWWTMNNEELTINN